MRVVDDAVEDGIGECRIADGLVPVFYGQLGCEEGGSPVVAVVQDLQEVLGVGDR